jgi:hypothetical protein
MDAARLAAMISALLLLLAGLCHLVIVAVDPVLWLPLALGPPVLGVAWVLLWRRPPAARAVALFDRYMGCNELLLSGWEACSIPAEQRSAGADAVLRKATAWARSVAAPADWAKKRQGGVWRSGYTAGIWTLAVVAMFLLQLPGKPAGTGGEIAPVETADVTMSRVTASRPSGGEHRGQAAPAGGRIGPDTRMELAKQTQEPPATAAPLEGEALAAAMAMSDPAAGAPAAGAPVSDIGSGGLNEKSGDESALPGGIISPGLTPELQLRYSDIARQISLQATQTFAGQDSVAFTPEGMRDTGPVPGGQVESLSFTVPYDTRFSPSQRSRINTYFEYLEALP